MTQDEIIEMARQAGWKDLRDYDLEMRDDIFMGSTSSLKAFAQLVAAKEREACIELIKSYGPTLVNGFMLTEAIRARSNSRGEA